MVAKAKEELELEMIVKEEEKQKYLAERAPPLNMNGLSLAQLQVTVLADTSFMFYSLQVLSNYYKVVYLGHAILSKPLK